MKVVPSFVELVLQRLTHEVQTSELRTMCLQVVIAAFYYNSPLLLETLQKIQIPNIQGSILAQFLKQWLHDTDCFLGLHDRKVCVLGLCSIINMSHQRPEEISAISPQVIPSALLLFQGLKRAYASRAKEEDDSDDDENGQDDDNDGEILESDEDEIDEDGTQYLEKLEKSRGDDDDDSDAEFTDEGAEETALESYNTPLDDEHCHVDEYFIFKQVLHALQSADPAWYSSLTSVLTVEQLKELEEVFQLADQRKAAADSKQIEQRGGFVFTNKQVPASFNFGSMG